MIFDGSLILAGGISAANALTGTSFNGAGTAVGPNSIDFGPPMIGGAPAQLADQGPGENRAVNINVLTAPTVGSSCKYQLIQADDAALTTNVQVLISTADIPIASLPAGARVVLLLDRAAPVAAKRYVGLQVVTVGAIATHSIFAGMLKDVQDVKTVFKNNWAIL